MKFFFKTLQTFLVLIFITACGGGGGGGASFSITANSQSFSTDEDAIFIGTLTALTSTASTVTFQKFSDPSYGTSEAVWHTNGEPIQFTLQMSSLNVHMTEAIS